MLGVPDGLLRKLGSLEDLGFGDNGEQLVVDAFCKPVCDIRKKQKFGEQVAALKRRRHSVSTGSRV